MILLNRYELLKGYGDHDVSVGFGSYGTVKLAKDLKTGQNVAVKIVSGLLRRCTNWPRTRWCSTTSCTTQT